MNNPMAGTDPTGYACTGSRINDCDATGAAVLQFANRPNDQKKPPESNGALLQDDPQNIGRDLTATEKLLAQDKNLGITSHQALETPSMMEETFTVATAIAVRGRWMSQSLGARELLRQLGKPGGRAAVRGAATALPFPATVAIGAILYSPGLGGCDASGCADMLEIADTQNLASDQDAIGNPIKGLLGTESRNISGGTVEYRRQHFYDAFMRPTGNQTELLAESGLEAFKLEPVV